MRPLPYQIKEHLLLGLPKRRCLVCKKDLHGQILDFPGQMRCGTCGVTYQIEGSKLSKKFLQTLGLIPEQVARVYCDCFEELPIYRAYWDETKRPVPLGTFRFPIRRRKLIPDSEVKDFYSWLWKNREKFRPHYENEFKWDDIGEKFGEDGDRPLIVAPY